MYLARDTQIMEQGAAVGEPANISSRCAQCSVRDTAICSSLSKGGLGDLQRIGRRRTLQKGQSLIWEDDDATVIANVLSGMLKLSSSSGNGSEQILGLVGPGGFAGSPHGGKAHHNVTALIETEICVFPSESFSRFADDHPEIRVALLDRSLAELDRLRRWMILLGRGSAAERVAALLVDFAGDGIGLRSLPLSRGQIAEYAGLTIETVSRQFTRLRTAGIIRLPTRDTFEVIDREALLAISNLHHDQLLH